MEDPTGCHSARVAERAEQSSTAQHSVQRRLEPACLQGRGRGGQATRGEQTSERIEERETSVCVCVCA